MSKHIDKDLEFKIKKRVDNFCRKRGLISNSKTIEKFATIKMVGEEDYNWELDILDNPYILMKLQGVGFVRADSIAMKLNFPFDHKFRILAYVSQSLDTLSKGSTILSISEVLLDISNKLGIKDSKKIVSVVLTESDDTYKLLDNRYKITEEFMEVRYLTKSDWYYAEKGFYSLCLEANKQEPLKVSKLMLDKVISELPHKLNEGQYQALTNILTKGVNVLTGSAGSGKTFTVKAIINLIVAHKNTVCCLAPTGIASKVFKNATGFDCRTVHSYYHGNQKILSDYLILEESSMYGVEHIKMIRKMIDFKQGCPKIIMIGDVNQLLSIAPSKPFYDLISLIENKKINGNVVRLTEIMRASNDLFIPHLCNEFTENGIYNPKHETSGIKAGVEFKPLSEDVPRQLLSIIESNKFNFKNTYILCPQNIGDFGNHAINSFLDEIIADSEILYSDKVRTFRRNSILLHTKNNYIMDIYNGERVILREKINEDCYLCEKIEDGTILEYDLDTLKDSLIHSYAISCHKCQGITAENVIFIASEKFNHMNTRNLIYTALSRASKNLIILHDNNALSKGSKKVVIDKRVTFLGELAKL